MISPLVEKARIAYALRNAEARGFKIYKPQELVQEAVEKFGDQLCVSCSFGSCSVVVLHMALQVNPKIKVVFNNTGVEYPETYAYRDLLKKEWNLNLIETKAEKSFWQCIKEYGFPLLRQEYSFKVAEIRQKTRSPFHKPQCCIFLKEKPMAKATKEFGIRACITGLRCAESGVRMFTLAQRGQSYDTKKGGMLWRYHPIGFWSHKQVWNYLEENNIPINEIYNKGIDRSGCMPCTGFLHWDFATVWHFVKHKSIYHLKAILGHEDIQSTEHYLSRIVDVQDMINEFHEGEEGLVQTECARFSLCPHACEKCYCHDFMPKIEVPSQ